MSILIKGMDMPQHCYECLLRQGNCCLLLYEAIPPTVPLTRLDDCPLIEIPTPHGRLIDEKQLKEALTNPITDETSSITWGDIDNAPTILEEEK